MVIFNNSYISDTQIEALKCVDFGFGSIVTTRSFPIRFDGLVMRNCWVSNPGSVTSSYMEFENTGAEDYAWISISNVAAIDTTASTNTRPDYFIKFTNTPGILDVTALFTISNIDRVDADTIAPFISFSGATSFEAIIMDPNRTLFDSVGIASSDGITTRLGATERATEIIGTDISTTALGDILASSLNFNLTPTELAIKSPSTSVAVSPLRVEKSTGTLNGDIFVIFERTFNISFIEMNSLGDLSFNPAASDRRLKSDYKKLENTFDKLVKVPVYAGKIAAANKEHPDDEPFLADMIYHIADEMQAQFPHLVRGESLAVDERGRPIYQRIHKEGRGDIMWAALIDAHEMITALRHRVEMLERRVD